MSSKLKLKPGQRISTKRRHTDVKWTKLTVTSVGSDGMVYMKNDHGQTVVWPSDEADWRQHDKRLKILK